MSSRQREHLSGVAAKAPESRAGPPPTPMRIAGPEPRGRFSRLAIALAAALALVAGAIAGYFIHGTSQPGTAKPPAGTTGKAFRPDVPLTVPTSFHPKSAWRGYARTVFRASVLPFPGGVGWEHFWEARETPAQPAMTVGPDGTLWVLPRQRIGRGPAIASFDGEHWSTWAEGHGLPTWDVHSLAVGPDGTVWAATGSGIARLDGKTWKLVGSREAVATSVTVAPDGSVWAIFRSPWAGKGIVSRFDGTWHDFAIRGDSVAVGPDGTVWIGASYFGTRKGQHEGFLASYDGEHWRIYHRSDGLPGEGVTAVLVTVDGAVWAAVDEGFVRPVVKTPVLARFNGRTWTVFRVGTGTIPGQIQSMAAAPDGTLWVATTSALEGPWGELASFDGSGKWTWNMKRDLRAVTVAPDGTIWVGKARRVIRFTPA